MRKTTVGTCLAGLLVLASGASAQEADIQRQIRELKQGQQQIRRDLAEIKRMLEQAPRGAQQGATSPVAGKIFQLADNPVKGESTAKLTLVEFSDYQ